MSRQFRSGSMYGTIHDDGRIQRLDIPGFQPSDTWRCTGAVRLNNFGHVVERFSLADVLAGGIEWKHKNGKQRVHITDLDHGTFRVWGSPDHTVY